MKDNSNIQQAILNIAQSRGVQLKPRQDFDIITQPDTSSFQIIWKTQAITQPTIAEIEAAENLVITESLSTAYIQKRKNAYPSTGDQLDTLWHAFDACRRNGTCDISSVFEAWYKTIRDVKIRYPKGL